MRAQKLELLGKLKKLCSGAVIFGFITSAGGNVLHAIGISTGQAAVTVIIYIVVAVLVPIIFGAMFEIVTRILIRREAHWLIKISALFGGAGISGITAWNSYFHQKEAFGRYGDATQAALLPLAIDGLMIIGSVYLIELGFQIRDLEAYIASEGLAKKTTKPDDTVKPSKPKEANKRERVAALLAQNPAMAIRDIARLADASYNYTHALVTELRRADSAELVSA